MFNKDLRAYAKEKGVFLWQCAQVMGISEPTMTRRLRTELPKPEEQKFFKIIDDLAKQSDLNPTTQNHTGEENG